MFKEKKHLIFTLFVFLISCNYNSNQEKDSIYLTGVADDFDFETVRDIDGNLYKVVDIGKQKWLAENLKTTRYNDGSPIPNIESRRQWRNLNNGAYCWYKNNYDKYGSTYGALYNFYAVKTGKLCPVGWRVPTVNDFRLLIETTGGIKNAGNSLKIQGNEYWLYNKPEVTNLSGFAALPGGYRSSGQESKGKDFSTVGYNGFWWSSTPYRRPPAHGTHHEFYDNSAYDFALQGLLPATQNYDFHLYSGADMKYGFSVRCIKK